METVMNEPIDLNYRPAGYFGPQALEDYVLSRVKNALVRNRLKALLDSNQHDAVARLLREEGVSERDCKALERLHPHFMGGNYLPDAEDQEVEIARIFIHSTTGDVTSVYAQPVRGRIHYRVVDEYGGDTLDGETEWVSEKPLTLEELYGAFTEAWPFHSVLEANFEGDAEGMLGFFVAESDFYPQLDALCRLRVLEAFP
jgi:hypothetical protein